MANKNVNSNPSNKRSEYLRSIREQEAESRYNTKLDGEDEYTEDVDRDYTKSKEEPIINIDESSALGKLVINKYAKKILVNRFSLGLYSVTETHIKKQVQHLP